MHTITFTCETITPMFLSGADGTTPELRAPSIKGALRFWWRAMNGHLGLDSLREKEAQIFGSPDEKFGRSKVLVRVIPPEKNLQTASSEMVPHKPFMKRPAFLPNQRFKVIVSLNESQNEKHKLPISREQLQNLFILTCLLGGLGKRVRRGMGSINIVHCDAPNWKNTPITLEYILNLIKTISPHYSLQENSIHNIYSGRMEIYPWVKQIEIGKVNPDPLLLISNTTHQFKEKNRYTYEPSIGHAFKGRFASPIYVSTVKGSLKPIITTLNTIPDKGIDNIDTRLQKNFKNQILG